MVVVALAAGACAMPGYKVSTTLGALSRRDIPAALYEQLGPVEGRHCKKGRKSANIHDAVADAQSNAPGANALIDAVVSYESTGLTGECFIVQGDAVRLSEVP